MQRLSWFLLALFLAVPAACSADRGFSLAKSEEAPAMAPMAPAMETSTPTSANSAPAGTVEGVPGQAVQPAANVGRKLIRTARLDLLIEDYDTARPAIEREFARADHVIGCDLVPP